MFVLVLALTFVLRMFAGQRRSPNRGGARGFAPPGTMNREGEAPGAHTGIPAGWLPDPSGRFERRYWSGTAWTEHVTSGGTPSTDPPPDAGGQRGPT